MSSSFVNKVFGLFGYGEEEQPDEQTTQSQPKHAAFNSESQNPVIDVPLLSRPMLDFVPSSAPDPDGGKEQTEVKTTQSQPQDAAFDRDSQHPVVDLDLLPQLSQPTVPSLAPDPVPLIQPRLVSWDEWQFKERVFERAPGQVSLSPPPSPPTLHLASDEGPAPISDVDDSGEHVEPSLPPTLYLPSDELPSPISDVEESLPPPISDVEESLPPPISDVEESHEYVFERAVEPSLPATLYLPSNEIAVPIDDFSERVFEQATEPSLPATLYLPSEELPLPIEDSRERVLQAAEPSLPPTLYLPSDELPLPIEDSREHVFERAVEPTVRVIPSMRDVFPSPPRPVLQPSPLPSPNLPLILFDWEDTLFPSGLYHQMRRDVQLLDAFAELDQLVAHVLVKASLLGYVFILSASNIVTSLLPMPKTISILATIPRIECVLSTTNERAETMKAILSISSPATRNVVIADGDQATRILNQLIPAESHRTSIRLKSKPTLADMVSALRNLHDTLLADAVYGRTPSSVIDLGYEAPVAKPEQLTKLGKPVNAPSQSDLYAINPSPSVDFLRRHIEYAAAEDWDWRYFKAETVDFNMRWVQTRLSHLDVNRASDVLYWISPRSSRRPPLPELNSQNDALGGKIIANGADLPIKRTTSYVIVRFMEPID